MAFISKTSTWGPKSKFETFCVENFFFWSWNMVCDECQPGSSQYRAPSKGCETWWTYPIQKHNSVAWRQQPRIKISFLDTCQCERSKFIVETIALNHGLSSSTWIVASKAFCTIAMAFSQGMPRAQIWAAALCKKKIAPLAFKLEQMLRIQALTVHHHLVWDLECMINSQRTECPQLIHLQSALKQEFVQGTGSNLMATCPPMASNPGPTDGPGDGIHLPMAR